eukprot:4431261-Prymnesium_polylepis.6
MNVAPLEGAAVRGVGLAECGEAPAREVSPTQCSAVPQPVPRRACAATLVCCCLSSLPQPR